jgi:DNA-binding winged helix-turn-helix (wHTH) protein/TolB-like protein
VIPLEPKPARALALLVERAGLLVTRDELRAHLWDPGTHVDFDRALAYCIGQVRQALSDSADNPRFVQTVPKRGFKFVAPVSAPAAAEQPASPLVAPPVRSRLRGATFAAAAVAALAALVWVAQGRTPSGPPVVAVALFDNETGDPVFDRPLSRMTDVVVERLTALGHERIGVVGNHALLRQPRDGRDLDAIEREIAARFVVLVQLQRRAPELSLLLQLIRLDDGVHIWVRRLSLTAAEIDAVDEQVAARIEAAVRRHTLGEPVEAP